MVMDMLTINEMEIIKSALEGDVIRQKEYLAELARQDNSDIRFEAWLDDSQKLLKKISIKLMNMKARVH